MRSICEGLVFFYAVAFTVFSCASAPKQKNAAPVADAPPDTLVQLPSADKKRAFNYFSGISEETLLDIENGSPSSLRRAASSLRKSDVEYTDKERILFTVSAGIMELVWPFERMDWESAPQAAPSAYTGAVNSARSGIYDMSTGNADFLTLVLPSLVTVAAEDVSPFFERAEDALKQGLVINSSSTLANYLLGLLYRKKLRNADALPFLANALKGAPECFHTAYAYAECLLALGRLKEANAAALAVFEKYPTNITALHLCADTAFAMKNLSGAEEFIVRVLQQNPSDLPSLLFRIKILMERADYIHAASLLDVYSRQDSISKDYLLLRAQIQYAWSKNTAAAVATIETAVKRYPDSKEALLFAAKLAGETGAPVAGKSLEAYAAAVLEKYPDDETARQYAVDGFMQKKEWEKAYAQSSALLQEESPADGIAFRHVKICLALGKKDEAWSLISALYKTNGENEEVMQAYIAVMAEMGKKTQALELINRQLPSASIKLRSFLFYRRSLLQPSEADALVDLRSSLISNPRNSDSLFRLYEIYYRKADYRKAQYYLKQVAALNPNDPDIIRLSAELTNRIR